MYFNVLSVLVELKYRCVCYWGYALMHCCVELMVLNWYLL